MKARLPRKYKKEIKRKVNAILAGRMAQCAIVTWQSMAQVAFIQSQLRPINTPKQVMAVEKALAVAEVISNNAQAIGQIMSQKPNHWRDFLR